MDTLTHALSGALLARATGRAAPRQGHLDVHARMAAGFLAAAFPDCDFALRALDTLAYLNLHQGITHSLVLLPLWALLLAVGFGRLTARSWRAYYATAALGIAIHIAGDAITAYGPMLWAPLSDERISLPLVFVIDACFSAIIVVGLVASLAGPFRGAWAARAALLLLVGYVGQQAVLHQRAVGIGTAHATEGAATGATSQALPQPLSPFHWQVIVSHDEGHGVARVRLLDGASLAATVAGDSLPGRIAAAYRPAPGAMWERHSRFGETPAQAVLARPVWESEALREFRRFARFPALYRIEHGAAQVCVWFVDLRFTLPELPPSFVFGACRADPSRDWSLARRRGSFWID